MNNFATSRPVVPGVVFCRVWTPGRLSKNHYNPRPFDQTRTFHNTPKTCHFTVSRAYYTHILKQGPTLLLVLGLFFILSSLLYSHSMATFTGLFYWLLLTLGLAPLLATLYWSCYCGLVLLLYSYEVTYSSPNDLLVLVYSSLL